jgi:hypothetical protein
MIGDHELGARTRIADSVALPAWGTPGHPDQVIFETDLVTVGAFRCPVDHPLFRNTGPIHQSCVVFPRTSVRIEHETGPAILADPTVVTMYNAGQVVERQAISAEGDRCDWYSMAPGILRDAVRTLDRPAADEAEHVIRKPSFAFRPTGVPKRSRWRRPSVRLCGMRSRRRTVARPSPIARRHRPNERLRLPRRQSAFWRSVSVCR